MSTSSNGDGVVNLPGGAAIARMVQAHDPGPIFGMGGFQLLPFYEAVRDLGMVHHLIDDERSGVFAADAYARVTGRPGICDATLGPGALNLVTGLVESLNAGIPVVAIVGDTHRAHSTKNMTQESRQLEILGPACKELIRIEDPARIPEHIRRAFQVSTAGRPGPVVVAVPEDVSHGEVDFAPSDFWIDPAGVRAPGRRARPDAADVERAATLLAGASRPLILAGGGVHISRAYDELLALAEMCEVPVAHTLSGKGSIPCVHRLSIGLFGRYDRFANRLIESTDCLLAVGCKLGEIATKRYALPARDTPLVHLDVSAEEIGRWARVSVGLCGDAALGLADLREATASIKAVDRSAYLEEIDERRARWDADAAPRLTSEARPINVGRVLGELNAVLPAEAVLVADGGFAAHWAGLLYDVKQSGRGFVADRGLASIGYGLPGALGAQLGVGSAPVVGLTGDGGLNMSIGGLETARRAGANFTLVVVNNAASGYVKALQHAVYGPGSYQSSDLLEINFAAIAEGYGCRGVRIEDPLELRGALEEAIFDTTRPAVVDVVVTRDPGEMLPGVDSRTMKVAPGDRPV